MNVFLRGFLALSLFLPARADFSYTQTTKTTGGMLASLVGKSASRTIRIFLKGQKLKTEDGNTTIIIDLDARTITTLNAAQNSYTVKAFTDAAPVAAPEAAVKLDIRETGRKKVVNGFDTREAVLSTEVVAPRIGKAQVEVEMWLSGEVPGSQELRAFFAKNGDRFPWQALTGSGNNPLGPALSDLQKKMGSLPGAPVEEIIRMKAPGAMPASPSPPTIPSPAQLSQMQNSMAKARQQLEAMAAQGGPAAAVARQQLERMGPAMPQGASASSSGEDWLLELTVDSSEFSAAPLPDEAFQIPAGYRKT